MDGIQAVEAVTRAVKEEHRPFHIVLMVRFNIVDLTAEIHNDRY
jgi:hypothetical protein